MTRVLSCTCGANPGATAHPSYDLATALGGRFQQAPQWVQVLIAAVEPVLPKDFVGRYEFELNVFKGTIANINLDQRQSFK